MTTRFEPCQYSTMQLVKPKRLPEPIKPAPRRYSDWNENDLRKAMMAEPIASRTIRHPNVNESTMRKDAARSEIKALVVKHIEEHGKSKAFDITAAIGRKDTDVRPALLELEAERKIRISRGQRNCYICELVQ